MKRIRFALISMLFCITLVFGHFSAVPVHAAEITYVLNTNTKRFHRPDCTSVQAMKQKNRADSTQSYDEIIAAGYKPCKNCNPQPVGQSASTNSQAAAAGTSSVSAASASVLNSTAGTRSVQQQTTGITYVLNTNTKKFHRPGCSSVSTIKEKNRQDTSMSYAEVIGAGYEPCKKCNPN